MNLPTWREASWKVSKGFSTAALSEFIYKYEPTDENEKEEWRAILDASLKETRESVIDDIRKLLKGEKNG